MSVVKILLVIACIIVYICVSHGALVADDVHSIWRQVAMSMLLLPIAGIACWVAVAFLKRLGLCVMWRCLCGIALAIALVTMIVHFWPILLSRLDRIYLVEHIATNMMLCWFFAHTLFGGRTPIITTLARSIHPDIPDNVVRYTRTVTLAWALFFVVQILLSLLIYYAAPISAWSLFANVLNWPLVILMFAAEYACRKRVNPDFQHATVKESVAAYFNNKRKV
ncbi:hypothetical protein [Herminiimonas fonticola]|uniref:Putative membrane protein n=1 Tax=Herminiimonas fonticola TaxID=303380 RepID=A0A4R6GGW9_9BURK|nr:hypothetical protein [Herminiimonas fonticola]RBA25051.1 putative membrane protein [Herminiimonas fonticola]TDN94166.1 putative membrane protein [Herminiimonas fonticola]